MTFEIFQSGKAAKNALRVGLFAIAGATSLLAAAPAAADLPAPIFTAYTQVTPCAGDYRVSWSAVTGATYYQLFSRAFGTANFYLIGSTTARSTKVNTAPNGFYYEVQACDGTSCGTLSEVLPLQYYSGCD
jgi:hypothetical protein